MADAEVVSKQLEQIEQYHGELQAKQNLSKETFLSNVTERRAVERMFENAIQACIDLAKHIATKDFEYEGDASKEAVEILGENNVIDAETVATLTDATGFRNILAHEYGDVNPEQVFAYLIQGENPGVHAGRESDGSRGATRIASAGDSTFTFAPDGRALSPLSTMALYGESDRHAHLRGDHPEPRAGP